MKKYWTSCVNSTAEAIDAMTNEAVEIGFDGLKKKCKALFNKCLDSLNKVDASKFIQHLNG